VVSVQEWAEIRRMALVQGLSIREIARRTGRHRDTVRAALSSSQPPRYSRPAKGSLLDPFKDEVHRLLDADARIPSQRIRELLGEQGYRGAKTITDDYVREVRPLFLAARTHQRTTYRPGELLQLDLWRPRQEVPVGYGQTRAGHVVIAALGFSRLGAGTLIFSKEAPDVLWGIWRCLVRIGALPKTLVCDREGCLHAGGGRPTDAFASFCGQLGVAPRILEPGDCQAKGVVERLQGYAETSFEPGRRFANELDFQDQLDRWFTGRANVRLHRSLRARPLDRFESERERMRALPEPGPDLDRRFVVRVPAQPYVRVDRNDYSLDPRLVGRRVEVRVSQREVSAICLDGGELACRHRRVFAAHQELTAAEHQRALDRLRRERYAREHRAKGVEVEVRSLERYDELIPA
jgi:transposase